MKKHPRLTITGLIAFLALAALMVAGCTENQRAKAFGGTMTVKLPKDTKLVNATWKEESFWYLVRPMREEEKAERYEFLQNSSFGLIEGKVVIIETR